jgi:tRNA A-37 threonylcarbamoyl transferase component Bud32
MIKDRLGRVRELAHLGVANLHGAERDGEKAFLVWEYVEGKTLAEYLAEAKLDKARLAQLAQQIVLHVESLHSLGIVHGGLHGRNIIVTPGGEVRLTHVSPLLYHEETVDLSALQVVIREMGLVIAHQDSLEGIAGELSRIIRPQTEQDAVEHVEQEGVHVRRWALIGAIIAAAIGAGVAWMIWRNVVNQPGEPVAIQRIVEAVS